MIPIHPEMNEGPIGDLINTVSKSDVVDVWCKGCESWQKMNEAYAKILGTGEIESCGKCRK